MIDVPVTNGLIRWWPNLFDARDEITGQQGVVMGLLPPVQTGSDDETEFSRRTGWVQLQPAITNEVFTLAFWVICRMDRRQVFARLLAQETVDSHWILQTDRGLFEFYIGGDHFSETDWLEGVRLEAESWQHTAVARRGDGTSIVWVDGVRRLEGRVPHAWPNEARWLVVGNGLRAGTDFQGGVRDLCAFDRVLRDEEVRMLHGAGLPKRPALNTAARLAATLRPIASIVLTNVVTVSARNWIHERFTTENGLPGNIVKAVLQAQNGYLWVGTDVGLARFDGRHFRPFTVDNTPALKAIGQTVFSLAEDADGTIWAGVFGGLLRIRGLEFTAFTNGLPQRFVLQAAPAGDGSVWVAGFNTFLPRGPCWLRRFYPEAGKSSAEVVVPGHLRRLIMTTNGVWLAGEQPQQLHFWDGRSAATTVVGLVDDLGPTVRLGSSALPPDTTVRSWTAPDDTTNWWTEIRLGAGGPAFHWLWDRRLSRPWAARWAGPVHPEETWLGVSYALARLRESVLEDVEIADGLAAPEIACLTPNREGGVWFGTEEDGLHFLRERLIHVFTTREGLSANDVRSVCATPDGDVWAATADGLNRWRAGEWTSHLSGGRLRAVATEPNGQPWYGVADRGPPALQRLTPGGNFISLEWDWQDPNSLRFAKDGRLWVVCERGLTWIKPERLVRGPLHTWLPDPASTEPVSGRYAVGKELPNIWPLGLVEDQDGSIWMGSTADGLFHVADGQVKAFTPNDGLPGIRCVPVHLDNSGALWIMTEAGLTRRHNGRFQTIGQKDGMPKDILLDLIEDDLGNFWISGKRGLHRVPRQDLEDFFAERLARVQSLTLGMREGLLTPECSSLHYPTMAKTPDGHIWVATRKGLATFDPRRVQLDTQPLLAVIDQFVVNRREFPLPRAVLAVPPAKDRDAHTAEAGIRLPPGSGQQLEFHFAAISLVGADRIKFRHQLEGYDKEWSPETDFGLAFYTNLRPGRYLFRVKAANAHGIWSAEPTTLPFIILPYFWQTTAFYALCAIAVSGVAGGLHWHRFRALRREQELRHQQALATEKARIAADMHDELGATLTQITILGEVAKGQIGNQAQTRFTLDRISAAARDVTARMSDLVWATNPRNDTLDNLVAYLREHAASQLDSTAMRPCLDFPATLPECRVSATFRRNLLLVVKEAVNNAVKHSRATQVRVQLQVADRVLHLGVEDNGRGFDTSNRRPNSNGLDNIQRRIQDLGGEVQFRSRPGHGVRIDCRVPLT